MLSGHRTPVRFVVAALLALATGCSEPSSPTAVPKLTDASLAAGDNGKVKLKTLHLSANTLKINGASVDADFTIYNSGAPIQSGISVTAEIVQGDAVRRAMLPTKTKCLPSDEDGFLPFGNCNMVVPVSASNLAPGNAPLVEGLATLVMHVYQTIGSTTTELSNKNVGINLVAKPSISALSLASTTLAIGGPSTTWNATVLNPAATLQNVVLQAYISQGGVRRPAGGLAASCGAPAGNLPTGSCAMSLSTSASGSATPPFTPGAATFELLLNQTVGTSTVTLDTRTIAITLVSSTPTLENIEFLGSDFTIGGPGVPYNVKVKNPGFAISAILVQGEIVQEKPTGTVRRFTTAGFAQCGQAVGTLPTTDACVWPQVMIIPAPGPLGTLVAGPAQFVAHLIHRTSTGDTELGTKTVAITLTTLGPSIVSIDPASTNVVLGSGFTEFTTKLQNGGPSLTGMDLQGWISQPTGARHPAGANQVLCPGGVAAGELPTNGCTAPSQILARNSIQGTGTLIPGPATFELELRQTVGTVTTVVATKTIPITLVSSAVSIQSLDLVMTTIPLDGTSDYSVTISNPTATTFTNVVLQGYVDQGTATQGGGGTTLNCKDAGSGVLAPGLCTSNWIAVVSNNGSTNNLLVPGPATFRVQIIAGANVLAERSVPITITP